MTKQVLLSLVGSQVTEGENDNIELVTVANYYKRNGHHFLLYEEVMEDDNSVVKNTMKFDAAFFEITKKGAVSSQMLFDPQKCSTTYYATSAGTMMVNITTTDYTVLEEENYIEVYIRYLLDIDYGYSSDNEMLIRVAPQ